MYSKLRFDKTLNSTTEKLLNTGRFNAGRDGRLVPAKSQGAYNAPWIFANYGGRNKFCGWWNEYYCGHFKVIPSHCRFACWKTVIKPNNLRELFEVYEILRILDLPSKCGMDLRDYTYGAWAGFVYGDTLAIGRNYCDLVRERVPLHIPVFVKRGCTEMERLVPSDKWDDLNDHTEKEMILTDRFSFDEGSGMFRQGEWTKARIKERWLRHAIKIGDPTAQEVAERETGDSKVWERLVVHSIKYYEPSKKKKQPKVKKGAKNG